MFFACWFEKDGCDVSALEAALERMETPGPRPGARFFAAISPDNGPASISGTATLKKHFRNQVLPTGIIFAGSNFWPAPPPLDPGGFLLSDL